MKTLITKRNFEPLYYFLAFLSIFLLIRLYFVNKCKIFDSNISLIYEQSPSNSSYEYTTNLTMPIYEKIYSLEQQFGIVIIVFSIIIFYNLSRYFKTIPHKVVILLIEISLVLIIFSNTSSEVNINAFKDDNHFLSLLIFLPFLYFIYHLSIVGSTIDISSQINNEDERLHSENLNDLDKLLGLNLISKEEYLKKKEFKIKERIMVEIRNSEKYKLLLKSKKNGILTEDEFVKKLEDLVNFDYYNNYQNIT